MFIIPVSLLTKDDDSVVGLGGVALLQQLQRLGRVRFYTRV
jgi:hypothetical protein